MFHQFIKKGRWRKSKVFKFHPFTSSHFFLMIFKPYNHTNCLSTKKRSNSLPLQLLVRSVGIVLFYFFRKSGLRLLYHEPLVLTTRSHRPINPHPHPHTLLNLCNIWILNAFIFSTLHTQKIKTKFKWSQYFIHFYIMRK